MRKSRAIVLLQLVAAVLICGGMVSSVLAGQASKPVAAASSAAGKVDLNSASVKDLDSLPGVGDATAKKIIAGRPYSSVGDLSKSGIPAATVKKISPLVTVGAGAAPAAVPAASTKAAAPAAASKAATVPAKAAASTASQGTPGPGQVWVNTGTGVYHYPNSRYYGKTKEGKYMPEADAMKAGFHAAKGEKKPQ